MSEGTSLTERVRALALVSAMFVAVGAMACGPKNLAGPVRPGQALVVLLPDADSGLTGRASLTNESGAVELKATRDSALARSNRRPGPVKTLSDVEVLRIFGGALAALPQPLRHFTLFFRFDSDELTDESRAQLAEVVSAVQGRIAPEVAIAGHTDTVGTPTANYQLGMRRSTAVRNLLVAAGLDPTLVELRSHGEADPLIRTPNDTAEPRNRRVDISVR
jgi:outer membrane protein OmpA-like peptidoglycan-associated protein